VEAGFVWQSKDGMGIDGTPTSLGGALKYQLQGVDVELVTTDVTPHFHVGGFWQDGYLLVCPKPQSHFEVREWGSTHLQVRLPMPYHEVLVSSYGPDYQTPVARSKHVLSRMMDVTTTGKCMIAANHNNNVHQDPNNNIIDITKNNADQDDDDDKSRRFARGIVTVVTTRESVAQALVLAKKMNQWQQQQRTPNSSTFVPLEIYHKGDLSYHLEARFELYPFVTVVNLKTMATLLSSAAIDLKLGEESEMYVKALYATKLRHVLWVQPSVQFLYNPSFILQTVEYVHQNNANCTALLTKGGSCVTSTNVELETLLKEVPYDSNRYQLVQMYPRHSTSSILLNQTSFIVATVHQVMEDVGWWLHPSANYSAWATPDLLKSSSALVEKLPLQQASTTDKATEETRPIYPEYHEAILSYWQDYVEARRILLLDRPIDWIAPSGGLFWQYSTFNSQKVANESHHQQAPMVHIDLSLAADKSLVATYNDTSFSPYPFSQNEIPNRISSMHHNDIANLTNPCIPESTSRLWLYKNPYQTYECKSEPVTFEDEFFIYSIDAEVMYNLNAPTRELQVEQAENLYTLVMDFDDVLLDQGRVSIRFTATDNSSSAVLPEDALKKKALEKLPYYVNAPSRLACMQLVSWIRNQNSFPNDNVLGCYVGLDNPRLAQDWEKIAHKNNITVDVVGMPQPVKEFPAIKAICDMPQHPPSPEHARRLWKTSHIQCIEDGFEHIVHPWYIPMYADFSRLPSGLEAFSPEIGTQLLKSIIPARLQERVDLTDPLWANYTSHWGFTHLSDWYTLHTGWYQGDQSRKKPPSKASEMARFGHITQLLTVLLFLRLEELGYSMLDSPVTGVDRESYTKGGKEPTTWRHVFSRTADRKGGPPGIKFDEQSNIWKRAPKFVKSQTGLNFTTAMQHYILDRMGMVGNLNVTMTLSPSLGFVGPLEDMMLIGSTLASFGVSPKTRQQVVSMQSVEMLLNNTVLQYDNHSAKTGFLRHGDVKNLERHLRASNSTTRTNLSEREAVVDGYGLGLFCVHGLRHTLLGEPIRGWMASGGHDSLLYFDTTGMVLAFNAPTRTLGYEVTTAFGRVVQDIGNFIQQRVVAT